MKYKGEIMKKIMASIVGILLGMSQLNKPPSDPKVELKNDLEILNLLGENSKHYSKICEEIDEKISWIYPTSDMSKKMEKMERFEKKILTGTILEISKDKKNHININMILDKLVSANL